MSMKEKFEIYLERNDFGSVYHFVLAVISWAMIIWFLISECK